MEAKTVGFAFCGSFCTYEPVLAALAALARQYETVLPIMSQASADTDTRFGTAQSFRERIESICGHRIISTVAEAEPIGPKKLLDLLVVAPCTGNTLAKLAHGIADTPVTLAAKAHLRNARPVVLAVSTNDALAAAKPHWIDWNAMANPDEGAFARRVLEFASGEPTANEKNAARHIAIFKDGVTL